MKPVTRTTGAQSAGKALSLLRIVAAHHPHGLRLTDLIELGGLDRSTTHRLLGCLIEEGFVDRALPSKVYRLGIEAMQFSLLSAGMMPLIERFRPVMQELAQLSADTVFLVVRSGDHALCLHREEGSYPVKAFVVQPGTRRPLGLSSVGIGILARCDDEDVDTIYNRMRADYRKSGVTLEKLRAMVQETRQLGYSHSSDLNSDTKGVGCAVRLSGNGYAGVSIAAINSRMPLQRRRELGAALVEKLKSLDWSAGG
jgi:DNA-binding IclR family transcriptional regulator